eukprot:4011147-Karenia_brevis.AAC.1
MVLKPSGCVTFTLMDRGFLFMILAPIWLKNVSIRSMSPSASSTTHKAVTLKCFDLTFSNGVLSISSSVSCIDRGIATQYLCCASPIVI